MMPNETEPAGRILYRELSYRIISAFLEVFNALGYGFRESVYARSLEIALRKRGIAFAREVPVDVFFDGHLVGRHRLDLLVEGLVVIEIKSGEVLPKAAMRQTRSYLAAANLELGIILHIGPTPAFHRVLARKR